MPPGQGKIATKNRNLRRRLKKQHARVASLGLQNDNANGVNSIPLGTRDSSSDVEMREIDARSEPAVPVAGSTRAQPIFMASLSNKNKRKGFKQAMASTLPKKIVFAAPEYPTLVGAVESSALPFASIISSEVTVTAPNNFPRLVPPSDKQENGQLPPNMIVTSIDVEEGMHSGGGGRKTKNKRLSRQMLKRSETQEVENVVLDYGGEDDGMIPTQRDYDMPEPDITDRSGRDEWHRVEKNWDKLSKFTAASQVSAGSLIGWKVRLSSRLTRVRAGN